LKAFSDEKYAESGNKNHSCWESRDDLRVEQVTVNAKNYAVEEIKVNLKGEFISHE
jgi:hypothetical protein